jgi:uncharacterized protein YbbC (DUF1343 family)
MAVLTGLDRVEVKAYWPKKLRYSNIGLLVHPASVNRVFKHAIDIYKNLSFVRLKALFGPQHGIYGQTQDNMIEWEGFEDKKRGVPVYSLYSHTRKPTSQMLKDIDVLVVDLQDIGSRYYTFIWTMELCMQACLENGKSLVILDRPNPIGGHIIEGPVLDVNYTSFVGGKPLMIRHGMTIGEIANYLKNEFYRELDLYIIKMIGWKRSMWFNKTKLPWIFPSPNIPTLSSAIVYPGMCLLEGTNISEGRGTTKPFEICGAPFIDPDRLINYLDSFHLEGVYFRPSYFQPTFHKFSGQLCGGVQIHVLDREKFKPFKTGVAILKAIHDLYGDKFSWKMPPYEYENEKMPIDILAGSDKLRLFIDSGRGLNYMEEWWSEECEMFNKKYRRNYLIYS